MLVHTKLSAQSDKNGLITLTLKVPGTFTTLDPTQTNFCGRKITQAKVFLGNPIAGDAIISLTIQDIENIIPLPARILFADYPILGHWEDVQMNIDNQGSFISPTKELTFQIMGTGRILPSQVYIVMVIQKATQSIDTAYASITWDNGI